MLDELTRHAVAAWLAELAETAEPSSVGTRLCGMRRFCRWLVTEGELEVAPTDGIEIPSPPDKPVPILTDDEIAALLRTCAVPRGRPGVFDRATFLGRRELGRRHRQPSVRRAPRAGQTGPGPSCAVSFRENHWRGLADHHTMAPSRDHPRER